MRRYQVFVSSTYLDLKDERKEVMQTLLEMECIPAGMELFPAADDDAWELIKSVIDQSDYYLLVIGGKYGSTDSTGLSYTEKEYEYAIEKEIPIAAFLHKDPSSLTVNSVDLDPETREKLINFKERVQEAHHCKYWNNSDDLGGKVAKSMNLFFRNKPRVGWVKANSLSQEVTGKIQAYKERIEELEHELDRASNTAPEGIDDLESDNDPISIDVYAKIGQKTSKTKLLVETTWSELFLSIGPSLEDAATEQSFRSQLNQACRRIYLKKKPSSRIENVTTDAENFQMVKYQFFALGLIEKYEENRPYGKSWILTRYGERQLASSIVRRKPKNLDSQAL